MPLGKLQQYDWEKLARRVLKFMARGPLIALAIFAAGCFAFLTGMFIYRLTEFVYLTYLDSPW